MIPISIRYFLTTLPKLLLVFITLFFIKVFILSDNRQWDSIQLETLNLPYNNVLRELDLTPRIIAGANTYVTYGGKIMKRPGTISIANTTLNSFRIDRLWIYETLDTPVIVYLMASVFNGSTWALYYNRLDGASPGWTLASSNNLRHINVSTRPHEGTVSRGVFYAKAYPAAVNQEPLGTVLFNGTGGNPFTTFWGVVGPTTPARISGGVPRLSANITAAATTFNLVAQNNYNLLNWSQDLTQTSAWTANTIAVTSSNNAAPDGSNTADLVTSSGTNGYFYQPVTTVNGQTYIFSAWVKNSSNQNVQFAIYNGSGVGGTQLAASTFVAGNGWLRYFVTATATSTTTTVQIGGGNTLANTNTVQVWGAQFEINLVALTPSPYERTLGPFNLPAAPFNVQIDYELITVTAWTPGTGTVTTALRGAQGTVAAAHNANAPVVYKDWTASTHPVTVNNFWAYSYAYQTRSGHISNRSPLETNPDNNPSQTGPVINLLPKLQLYGTADTVNVPNLVVFRTTDGGGTWTQIAIITNTGFNPIQWQDTYLASTGGAVDPTPDSALNFQLIAPTLTSNSPPPTVISTNTTLSTLSVAMTLTTTTMNVATTYAGVAITAPAVPFTVTVDNEIMTVTAINTGTGVATVSRGINASTLQIHAIGANVIITPIVGLDTPLPSTPIAGYASRLWMGIGNILFYSAQEEINIGIPEEAWPSGQLGNFYRLQFPIVNLIDTTNSLYIITTEAIYQLTGSNLETFFLQPILHNIGGAIGHPQAVTKYRESVVWLTSDLRIAILQGGNFRILSEPLGLDYVNLINNQGASIILRYWAALDKDWIVLCASCTTPTNNQVWVYDVEKSEKTQQDFWNPPWSIQASAMTSGRIREIEQARRLAFAIYDGTNTFITRITDNSAEYVGYDAFPSVAKQTYDFKMKSNLWMVPPGDHVNLMRRPGLIPIVYGLILEETVFSTPATDPQIFYYTNDLWTTPKAAAAAEYSVHDDQPIGYRTRIFPIQEKARRFAFEIDKLQTTELFELQDFSIIYNSDSGSGI